MTENIFIQSELEKQDKNQISENRILKIVRFWIQFFQRVRFWKNNSKLVGFRLKSFTKRKVLDWRKYNVLDFELEKFGRVRFWKNICIQKITFWFFLLRENYIFCIFTAFLKGKILNWKFQYKSDFDLKDLQRVGFGIEKKHLQSRIERVIFFF